jgi:hypothetical protein
MAGKLAAESRSEDTGLAEIAGDYDARFQDWVYTIIPPLRRGTETCDVMLLQKANTLRSEDVFFGSTVRFSRRKL